MKINIIRSKELLEYIKHLESEISYRDKIFTQLEKYVNNCGRTYPNGRQFFIPYKCVDNIKHILYDVDDYIKINNLGVDKKC